MFELWSFFIGISLLTFIYKAYGLWYYLRKARATGLPYVVTPVLETEVAGLLVTPLLRWIYHKYLDQGQGWPRWCRFIIKDWSWEDKRRAHDEYGDVFLCVSPEGIICYCADAAMGWDVMNRRNDFTKPPDKYKLLEPYGPNVATAEGSTYRFHVRVTAPPFGDLSGVNELVWNETVYQTRKLSEAWARESQRELHMDVNSLTLAVISLAGFGKRVDWVSSIADEDIPKGYKISFLKAINDTTAYMVAILLFPAWFLRVTPLAKAALAYTQLDKYLREMIRSERSKLENDSSHKHEKAKANLLASVIRSSKLEAQADAKSTGVSRKDMFTEDEVLGNLFIYLLAGYETTANAIIYGLTLLALYPDIQEKVAAEIDETYTKAANEGREELTYSQDFESLVYTYAFMYESFRVYPGVTLITKMAGKEQPIYVTSANGNSPPSTYNVPAGTRVYLSAPGTHFNPRYWPDPYKFNPSRWLAQDDSVALVSSTKDKESATNEARTKKIITADKTRQMRGTLLTFSDGARACLGRKFAQAEYVAFLTGLLREYKVVLAPDENAKSVERDMFLKSAGKVTLSPPRSPKLSLIRRVK